MNALDLDLQTACADTAELPAADDFRRWTLAALAGHNNDVELTVRLVDEAEMQALNQRYRGQDKPTNVLSFPAELPDELDLPLLGDLVICAPVVAREAANQGKPARAHWAHLVVHGILHLRGHDHVEDDEAEHMEAEEIRILAGLDYPNPYEVAPPEDRTQSHERRSI